VVIQLKRTDEEFVPEVVVELPPKCPRCGAWMFEDPMTGEVYCRYCDGIPGLREEPEEPSDEEDCFECPKQGE